MRREFAQLPYAGPRSSPAVALIRPRFIPISRFDKSICRGERVISRWRAGPRGAVEILAPPLCLVPEVILSSKGGLVRARIDISTSDRVMPWKMYLRGMSFEAEVLLARATAFRGTESCSLCRCNFRERVSDPLFSTFLQEESCV